MARANTPTLVSVDRFGELLGIHPLHLNQVMVHNLASVKSCGYPITQYSWQDADRVGREEIAMALYDAERWVAQWLGFDPGIQWHAGEEVNFMRKPVSSDRLSSVSQFGYVLTGGQRAKTLIDDNVAVVFSDTDGDGYSETATITVATTVTDTSEIKIYYPGRDASDSWEIPTTSVSISGGTATILTKRERLVLEDLMEALEVNEVDGLIDANFLSTVDVYRVYNDPSKQVEFYWDRHGCTGDGCEYAVQTGCIATINSRKGWLSLQPGTFDADDLSFSVNYWTECRPPDRAKIWYKAGLVDQQLERAVCYLALVAMDRPVCSCAKLDEFSRYWTTDFSLTNRAASNKISRRNLDNPFGPTRAGVYAWNVVSRLRIGEGSVNA